MRLCKTCALDHECYYFFLYPSSRGFCECCGEYRLCFDVGMVDGGNSSFYTATNYDGGCYA